MKIQKCKIKWISYRHLRILLTRHFKLQSALVLALWQLTVCLSTVNSCDLISKADCAQFRLEEFVFKNIVKISVPIWNKFVFIFVLSHSQVRLQSSCYGQNKSILNALFNKVYRYSPAVRPDWTIYWTLDNFLNPLATINLPQSLTFLGNFCIGVKIYHFPKAIIFG